MLLDREKIVLILLLLKSQLINCERVIQLTEFNRCTWRIDLSTSRHPLSVQDTYFNEKRSFDVKESLQDPNITKFILPVTKDDSKGYYAFPYFILIRASCDSGSYDDSYYRIIMHGTYPSIILSYAPQTSRDPIRYTWRTFSTGGLVNVIKPEKDNAIVPPNPNYPNCYLDMCYPGFVVPLVFLQVPIFEVKVEAMDVFSKATARIHVSPYTSRKGDEESSSVELGSLVQDVSQFFPTNRITNSSNQELLPESFLEDLIDDDHFPLDTEDFFDPQYTYGSAPVIIFSGFYQPDLIIMADPDLNSIRPIKWERNPLSNDGKPDENFTIFDHALTCRWLDKKYNGNDFLDIPIYSSGEGEFWNEPLGTNYRKRFSPMYYQNSSVPNAIYEAIVMEDRLLLVTYSGLVVLYGTSNITVYTDTALKAPANEKLRKCFKFVRVARHAAQGADLILAATYHYIEQQTYKNDQDSVITKDAEIEQEIWMGKLTTSGKPLSWNKLGETENMDNLDETSEKKQTQVDQICNHVREIEMKDDRNSTQLLGHCWVIDGTPAAGQKETIQVLVEMRIRHLPTIEHMNTTGLNIIEDEADLTFYIIAQHTPLKSYSKNIWEIITIIPRRPCVGAHRQKIQTIERYSATYFNRDEVAADDPHPETSRISSFKKNCHYANRGKATNDLYLDRMTYTRQSNGHLFLYGNKLVHSTNGGQAFAYLQGFPDEEELNQLKKSKEETYTPDDEIRQAYHKFMKSCRSHVIKVMAFSNGGHFAFLTSKRHLYLGSTGTVNVIRLRPSPGYSMIRTSLTLKPGLHDGRPFSVLFDSQDRLFEMIVTVNSKNQTQDIRRRPIPWNLIIQNTKFVEKLRHYASADKQKKPSPKPPIDSSNSSKRVHQFQMENDGDEFEKGPFYSGRSLPDLGFSKTESNVFKSGKRKYLQYCPFGDPQFYQNYSNTMSREQDFMIRTPLQHATLGLPLLHSSLMAFQASSFSLIHNMFLNPKEHTYSHTDTDAFKNWISATAEESQLGFFRFFTDNPIQHGVVVNPSSFKQLPQNDYSAGSLIPSRFYLDFKQVVLIELTFSISTTATIEKTDYKLQKLSLLQMTIDNGNGSILEVETERIIDAKSAAVAFNIYLSINSQTARLKQHLPGETPTVVPISFHFIGGFGNCFANDAGTYIGDHLSTTVYAGCRPSTQLQFNWNSTLRSMRFRSPKEWMGEKEDCYNNEIVCLYKQLPFVLHFEIYDSAKQRYTPYTGKYKLRVVAGGYSRDKMEAYPEEQQEAFNIPGKSDVSLIWLEWNITNENAVRQKLTPDTEEDQTQEVILQAGKSAVKWACHTLSPCARVWPTLYGQSIYYFKIRISNRDVDSDTLCLHERDFIIQFYGFTPSPEIQLLISSIFCIIIILFLHVMYICCRNQRKVWRANKVKMYGWLQIIVDTFPKAKKTVDLNHELTQQMRRDEILMSLAGHLRVPDMLSSDYEYVARKEIGFKAVKPKSLNQSLPSKKKPSSSKSSSPEDSSSSLDDENETILPSINPRHAPATWTDMIYDQIITKRLHAIIQRNNDMKESILKKVDYTGQLKSDVKDETEELQAGPSSEPAQDTKSKKLI